MTEIDQYKILNNKGFLLQEAKHEVIIRLTLKSLRK